MPSIVDVENVEKHFYQRIPQPGILGAIRGFVSPVTRRVSAVDGISFQIGTGEAIGYLGPNGAGKSTMIKMLTGIMKPSSGSLNVMGRDPTEERIANAFEIGVVFGQRSQLWWDLPLLESFEVHRRIYRIPSAVFMRNRKELVELMQLSSFLERPVRMLSLGQRMRAEIAMGLMHGPKILFLDEPTIGLDLVAKNVVRRFLSHINRERGTTIMLTTHDMQDIEEICPRLLMVGDGKLLFDGTLAKLRSSLGTTRRLVLEFSSDPGPISIDGVEAIAREGLFREIILPRDSRSLIDLLGMLDCKADLRDARLQEPSIEEVVRLHYQAMS